MNRSPTSGSNLRQLPKCLSAVSLDVELKAVGEFLGKVEAGIDNAPDRTPTPINSVKLVLELAFG